MEDKPRSRLWWMTLLMAILGAVALLVAIEAMVFWLIHWCVDYENIMKE